MTEEKVNQNGGSASGGTAQADAGVQRNERIALLEGELAAREEEIRRQRALIQEHEARQQSLSAGREAAVDAYRGLVARANPLVPAELVTGGTVEEIDASLRRAVEMVGHIQAGLEQRQKADRQAQTVPAGAPGRMPPDVSAMTTREKINYGLNQARQNR